MSRMVGTVSRGIRAPIIREGDDLAQIVVDSIKEAMKEDGYSWWRSRIEFMLTLFDGIRIDHFRGIESYWTGFVIAEIVGTILTTAWGLYTLKVLLKERAGDKPSQLSATETLSP